MSRLNKFTLHLTPGPSRPSAAWTPGIKRSHRRRVRGLWYSLHGYVRVAHVYSMFGVAVHTHRRKPNKFTLLSTPGPSRLSAAWTPGVEGGCAGLPARGLYGYRTRAQVGEVTPRRGWSEVVWEPRPSWSLVLF